MWDTVFAALAPLVKRFEGLRLKAYLCPAGVATIGYGHTPASLGTEISKPEADAILNADLAYYVAQTVKLCPTLALAPAAVLAAISDFSFNLGVGRLQASTLRRRINAGEWDEVQYELRRWVRAGGRVLPGLVARREAECALIATSGQSESTSGKPSGILGG